MLLPEHSQTDLLLPAGALYLQKSYITVISSSLNPDVETLESVNAWPLPPAQVTQSRNRNSIHAVYQPPLCGIRPGRGELAEEPVCRWSTWNPVRTARWECSVEPVGAHLVWSRWWACGSTPRMNTMVRVVGVFRFRAYGAHRCEDEVFFYWVRNFRVNSGDITSWARWYYP